MHIAVLGIGSNVDNATQMIEEAVKRLVDGGCCLAGASDVYQTRAPYFNQVVRVCCSMDYVQLVSLSKSIERLMGRSPDMKARALVPIDIDVVVVDDVVVRPRDFSADYFSSGFAQLSKYS